MCGDDGGGMCGDGVGSACRDDGRGTVGVTEEVCAGVNEAASAG